MAWWDVITSPIQQAVQNVQQTVSNIISPPTPQPSQTTQGGSGGGAGYTNAIINPSTNQPVSAPAQIYSPGGSSYIPSPQTIGNQIVSGIQNLPQTISSGIQNLPSTFNIGVQASSQVGIPSTVSLPPPISVPNSPFAFGDQSLGFISAMNSPNPQTFGMGGMTLNVAFGDQAQQQVKNINAVVYDPVSGGWSGYTTPYGHSISNIATGGGAGSLQSGKFTIGEGKELTPVLYTQSGGYKRELVPGANVAAATMVLSNPDAYSNTGAERYGGVVSQLITGEAGKLRPGVDVMGVYPAASGNLANLVSQEGVNQSKTTWADTPWNIEPSTQGIFKLQSPGVSGTELSRLSPTEYSLIGMAPPSERLVGSKMVAGSISTTELPQQISSDTTPKNEWDMQSPFGGLIGLALWGDKKDEVLKGAVASSIDFITGIVGQTPMKDRMTTTDPALIVWRAENEQKKLTATPEEYNQFLQQSFEKGILVKPVTSSTFIENPELTYGYGEFTKWGIGVGNTIKERIGITQPSLEAYQYNVEKTGSFTDRIVYGVGATVSTHPEKIISAYGGGAGMVVAGEIAGGLYAGSMLEATMTSFALAHPTAAAIATGITTYGIPTALAGITYYGASEGFTASPARTEVNLGKMFPELVGVTIGAGSAYAFARGIDSGYIGFQSREVKQPIETVYLPGWETSARVVDISSPKGAAPVTPEYLRPLGSSTETTRAGAALERIRVDFSGSKLVEDLSTKAPESWRDVRTAPQTLPAARPIVGEAVYTIPKTDVASIEPANFFHDTTIRFKGSETPTEIKGSGGQSSIVQARVAEISKPPEIIDLTSALTEGRGTTALGTKASSPVQTNPSILQARVESKTYWSPENPMKLRKGYDIHNTAIKGSAPSGAGAGNWLKVNPQPEEMQGYLRIALMERTNPIEFLGKRPEVSTPVQPDIIIGRQRMEPIELGRVGFEPASQRVGITDNGAVEKIGTNLAIEDVLGLDPVKTSGRIPVSTAGTADITLQGQPPITTQPSITTTENMNQNRYAPSVIEQLVRVTERPVVPTTAPSSPKPSPERTYSITTPEIVKPVPERPIVPTTTIPTTPFPERPIVPIITTPTTPVPIIPIIPPFIIPKLDFPSGGGGSAGTKNQRSKRFTDIFLYGEGIGNFGSVKPLRFGGYSPPKSRKK